MFNRSNGRRGGRAGVLLTLGLAASLIPVGTGASAQDPSVVGRFGAPFAEPTINGEQTDEFCVENDETNVPDCKVAAVTASLLPNGEILYFNGLENTEYFEVGNEGAINAVAQAGSMTINDQTRVIDIFAPGGPVWTQPENNRAETHDDIPSTTIIPLNDADETDHNNQALFCADVQNLPDGRVLAIGGTNYYTEPEIPGTGIGVVELEGTTQARVYDPETNTWGRLDDMEFGRWYPTGVTLPDGDQFVASGVTKLIKPVYTSTEGEGAQIDDSGRNVVQSEILDLETMEWSTNAATRSLPLFPRLHLLPNGEVFYNAAGQVYNPQGQAYDQALWNIAATYNRDSDTWTDLGVPGLTAGEPSLTPGFRGSGTSIMLPLQPNAETGEYNSVEILSAGGTIGVTPGSYVAVDTAYVTTLDIDGDEVSMGGAPTGSLNAPRWYGHGVLLPDGQVFLVNGADRDEVVNPGSGQPNLVPELWSPDTGEWITVESQTFGRTYHNMAMLLPDGTVMVSGHSPIPDGYGLNGAYPDTIPGVGDLSDNGRNPTIEIWEPPYLFTGENRPVIRNAPSSVNSGESFRIQASELDTLDSIVLVRNPSITHLVDGDQRTVELQVTNLTPGPSGSITVTAPPAEAAPPGDYMLFVNRTTADGTIIPSVSVPVHIS